MEQKIYKVNTGNDCNFFVIGYSKEHAIVEVVNLQIDRNILCYPSDLNKEDVKEVSKKEAGVIIVDYNYATEEIGTTSLEEIFKLLTDNDPQEPEFYGVIADDFVDYGI